MQAMREEKNLDHQIDIMQTLIRQDENETKRLAKAEALWLKQEKRRRTDKRRLVSSLSRQ